MIGKRVKMISESSMISIEGIVRDKIRATDGMAHDVDWYVLETDKGQIKFMPCKNLVSISHTTYQDLGPM